MSVIPAEVAAAAHAEVNRMLQNGGLIRQPCEECGDEKTDAHHDDYSRPLDVRWLCRSHHRRWHIAHPSTVAWAPSKSDLARTTTYLPKPMLDALRIVAKAERRSLSSEIAYRLQQSLEDEL